MHLLKHAFFWFDPVLKPTITAQLLFANIMSLVTHSHIYSIAPYKILINKQTNLLNVLCIMLSLDNLYGKVQEVPTMLCICQQKKGKGCRVKQAGQLLSAEPLGLSHTSLVLL